MSMIKKQKWLASGLFALMCALSSAANAILPIEHWTTAQGVRVYFVAAPSIPMLDVQIDFDAGSRFDSRGKAGVASLTNSLLAKGVVAAGALPELSEAQIAEGFARIGAQRGGGAGDDRASISLRTLTSQAERGQGIALLARLVTSPSFPDTVLAREKERVVQSIREAETKPETIAGQAYSALLYGDHPYGFDATAASITAISVNDLKQFYERFYVRDGAVVSMVGAVTRAEAEKIAIELTAGLKPRTQAVPTLPVITSPQGADKRIEHPANQSHIFVGTTGVARGNPDYFSVLVANYVLGGGGFVSRLYKEVREKRGLVYSVYSYFSPQLQQGPFTIGLQTQREQTGTALKVVNETLQKFVAEGPSQKELNEAKSNLVGGFALRIDNNRKILDNVAMVGYYQLPLDYLDKWTSQIEKVSLLQARDAFRKYVDPSKMVTVVVGNAAK